MICQRLAQVLKLMQSKSRELTYIGVKIMEIDWYWCRFTICCFRICILNNFVDYVVFVVWLRIVMINAMYCNDQNNLSQNLSDINSTGCLFVQILFIHSSNFCSFYTHHTSHITHTSHIHQTYIPLTLHILNIHYTYITHTTHTLHILSLMLGVSVSARGGSETV